MSDPVVSRHDAVETHEAGTLRYQVLGHSENMSVLHWMLPAGAKLPEHQHEQEQLAYVVRGSMDMIIAGQSYSLNAGDSILVPANAPHAVNVHTDTETVDVFSPPRTEMPTAEMYGQ